MGLVAATVVAEAVEGGGGGGVEATLKGDVYPVRYDRGFDHDQRGPCGRSNDGLRQAGRQLACESSNQTHTSMLAAGKYRVPGAQDWGRN